MIYAQVIDGVVNMIGGEEVGLPLPEKFLEDNPNILNIDITDLETQPEINWLYDDKEGTFTPFEGWTPEPMTPPTHTNTDVIQAINDMKADLMIAGLI